MAKISHSKRFLNNIKILVLFLIASVKLDTTELEIEDLEKSLNEPAYFHFTPKSAESLPNNLKIEIDGTNPDNSYVISYYKDDSTFTNRNQMSQSISGKSFMWLNNIQIKDGFYLSVECSDLPCEYSLKVAQKEKIELELAEPYSYYVTEENKETTFIVHGNPKDLEIFYLKSYCKISIWAKGNYDLKTELKLDEYTKHPKYNAYLVYMENPQAFEYTFIVTGTPGDYINVGALFFDGYNYCGHIIKDLGLEISVFFSKKLLDDAYFFFKNETKTTSTMYYYDYEHDHSDFLNNEYCRKKQYTQIFVRVDPNDDHAFFSLQYIEYTKHETSENKKIKFYPPQKLGSTYERIIKKDEIVGLIPMKPEQNYKYLTYHTAIKQGDFKAFIYKCDNFPLCKIDSESLKNSEELIDFHSASISYDKTKYNENISPISKSQNMLLLTCKTESCKLFTSMYTDKNKLNVIISVPYYKYIKKDNEDNYYMTINKAFLNSFSIAPGNGYIYINVEEISGQIEITPKENENYLNKKLIKFNLDKLDDFSLKIKAKNDSIYSIGASIHTDDFDLLTPQIDYLLQLNSKTNLNTLIFVDDSKLDNPNYFRFFSQVCNIQVKYSDSPINGNENFYQDCQNIDSKTKFIQYKINKGENKADNCLFSTSMFNLNNENPSLILGANIKYPFIFNEKLKKMQFRHTVSQKDIDTKIKLTISNNENYNVDLLLDSKEIQKKEISKSETINLNSDELKNCTKDNQPCNIIILLESKNEKESKVEIEIIRGESEEKKKENKKDHTMLFIILGVVGGVIVIVLIILIIVIKCKKKASSDLVEEIRDSLGPEGTNEMTLLQKDN